MIKLLIPILLLTSACQQSKANKEGSVVAANIQSSNTIAETMDTTKEQTFTLDYVMGKFDPSSHQDFIIIDEQYADQKGRYLHKDTYEAFLKMYAAAKKDGVNLKIISATRNFDNQKSIWEKKWKGETLLENKIKATTIASPKERALKILEYSSMPGSSRHHWGTDIDLNNLTNDYFNTGEGLKIYEWLAKNGADFGFVQVYTKKSPERPDGYHEEKWHWSFKPISSKLLALAADQLKNEMITGFEGANTAAEIDIVHHYVLGVNKACFK